MPLFGFTDLYVSLDELTNWQREVSAAKRIMAHAENVVERARAKIGAYQPAVGEWPAWETLADKTIAHKKARGAPDDQPLLGVDHAWHMRDDLTYDVGQDAEQVFAVIGIPDDAPSAAYAGVQEMGSLDQGRVGAIPARPFLRPAMDEEEQPFTDEMRSVIATWQRRAALRGHAAARAMGE